ncbi:MAG: SDR family oxidoreductase [Candidatus Parvarchaeota archaeon]
MRVLVTGGAGYIGSILTDMLAERGHEVTVLDRFLFGDTIGNIKGVTKILDDIRYIDTDKFMNILKDIDAVIDLAALSNDPSGELNPVNTVSINHLGRLRVATLAKEAGVRKYILPSSCSIYGFNDNYVDENSHPNPLTTYAKANLALEKDCLALNSDEFKVTVFRLATVYGLSIKRMRFDLVVNDIVGQIYTKGYTTLTTGGNQWRPFIHVRDVCKGIILGLAKKDLGGEVLNLGSNEQNYQIIEVAKKIFASLEKDEKYVWVGSPDTRSYRVKFDKIVELLDFHPDWDIGKGAREVWKALEEGSLRYGDLRTITVKWYKKMIEEGIQL